MTAGSDVRHSSEEARGAVAPVENGPMSSRHDLVDPDRDDSPGAGSHERAFPTPDDVMTHGGIMKHRSTLLARVLTVALTLTGVVAVFADSSAPESGGTQGVKPDGFRPVQRLLDLSGLVWMGGDTFLAVHDAKFPDEPQRVRTSLLQSPTSLGGIQWLPLRPHFPGEPSSDLESAARIPGTQSVLLLESDDDASGRDRIYLARVQPRRIRILDFVEWSSFTSACNVEGAAVARSGIHRPVQPDDQSFRALRPVGQ